MKRQPTAYETLCYLASQERADEKAAFARAEAEAEEQAAQNYVYFCIGLVSVALAVIFFAAI